MNALPNDLERADIEREAARLTEAFMASVRLALMMGTPKEKLRAHLYAVRTALLNGRLA